MKMQRNRFPTSDCNILINQYKLQKEQNCLLPKSVSSYAHKQIYTNNQQWKKYSDPLLEVLYTDFTEKKY